MYKKMGQAELCGTTTKLERQTCTYFDEMNDVDIFGPKKA